MKIDRKLNFVIPVDTDAGTLYVHSMPLSTDVFEANFLLISKTFSAIYNEGLGAAAAPRVASMLMRQIALDMNGREKDGTPLPDGPGSQRADALMAEVRRLSNVVAPGPGGWEVIPFQEALKREIIDGQDASEVENAIVFFIVASAMHRRGEIQDILDGAANLWGAQTSLLNCTAFAASLRTSTGDETSGEKTEGVSSVPS